MELVYQDLHFRYPFDPHRSSEAQTGPETAYIFIYIYNTFLSMNKPSTSHLNVALDTASKVCVLQNSDVTAENLLY